MLQQNASATRPYCGLVYSIQALLQYPNSTVQTLYSLSLEQYGQYYRDMLLMQKLLPAIRGIAGDVFVFQQDNAPAHRARDTVELLHRGTVHQSDVWPANSADLNPCDYRVWDMMQVYGVPIRDTDKSGKRLNCCDIG